MAHWVKWKECALFLQEMLEKVTLGTFPAKLAPQAGSSLGGQFEEGTAVEKSPL